MGECYSITIKDMKRTAIKNLRDIQQCYDVLKNKNSEYAKDVLAILDIRRKINDTITKEPDKI